jgi:hypothetical protein
MEKSEALYYDSVTMFVQNGRTVHLSKVEYGPGAEVALPFEEASRLSRLGFVAVSPPQVRATAAELAKINPAGIGVQRDKNGAPLGPQ